MKKRFLIINAPERVDTYSYLSKDKNNDYFILYYEKENLSKGYDKFIKKEFFWGDYYTPERLIKKIKPDVIIFFEVFDFHQIALAIAAKNSSINTFFFDHSASSIFDSYIKRSKEKDKLSLYKKIKSFQFSPSKIKIFLKVRYFYLSTIFLIEKENLFTFLKQFIYLNIHTSAIAIPKVFFQEKSLDRYILFNRNNYELYNHLYKLTPQQVFFSGIPYFDNLFIKNNSESSEEYIVFIESPLLEFNLYDWTNSFHHKVAHTLYTFSKKKKVKIYVKLHPRADKSRWDSYQFNINDLEVIQHGDFPDLYQQAQLIIGYPSTMIPGLLSSKKNLVLLGWNPEPKINGDDFSKMEICHGSLYMDELLEKYNYWVDNNLALKNTAAFNTFIKSFNYPADGLAGERIIEVINESSNEVNV